MAFKERSLDDMPLAAYTTGVIPKETNAGATASASAYLAQDEPVAARDDHGAAAVPAADGVMAPGKVGATKPGRARRGLPDWLTRRPKNLLDPRLIFAGMIVVGAILLVVSLIGGGGAPAGTSAEPSAPVVVAPPTPPPGEATLEITGALATTYQLSGVTGIGPAIDGRIESSWSNELGSILTLGGQASSVTRTTAANLVLGLTVLIDGTLVSFTSDGGECTIGMAVQPTAVKGSIVCKRLKSDDGKLTVDARGTYRT